LHSFKRFFLVALALALAATAVAAAPAGAAPKDNPNANANANAQGKKNQAPTPAIKWKPCYSDIQQDLWPDEAAGSFGGPVRFECSSVNVPLDYDGSAGGTIRLAVVRIPAADQANKIGSLFTNPGGPSGSGVEFTLFAAPEAFTPDIRANFDIIGFDPRGILLSTPARCYGNYKKLESLFTTRPPYPVGDAEIATWLDADAQVQGDCARRGNRILDHMSTANVARDMDVLREAVGDEQLTYVGYSYGSMIGSTYANLFPDNVRAMVLDSALDPVAWTTGYGNDGRTIPVDARLNSAGGAQDALDHFFELCDNVGPDSCPIAPNSSERYAAVHAALEEQPVQLVVELIDFETGEVITQEITFTAAGLVADTLGILYAGGAWPIISFVVADLESQLFGPPPPPGFAARFARDVHALRNGEMNTFAARAGLAQHGENAYLPTKGVPKYFNFVEGFPAVLCADSDNPSDIGAWPAAAEALDEISYFGSIWAWGSSICNGWPGVDDDRYTGPWDAVTANPVLIVNNEFDPATPLGGAVALDGLLGNSQLLVVEGGRGHIAAQESSCAVAATNQYLLTQQMPPVDLVCEPDFPDPFAAFGPPPLALVILPNGEEATVVLIETPDGPVALDPETGEPLNVDQETGEIFPIEIIEVLEPMPIEAPAPPVIVDP